MEKRCELKVETNLKRSIGEKNLFDKISTKRLIFFSFFMVHGSYLNLQRSEMKIFRGKLKMNHL